MTNVTYFYLVINMKWCGEILARAKYGKARNKYFLALFLIGTWRLMNILIQCKEAERKLCALRRVCKFLNLERLRSLMKAFIEFEFAYCPLVWMFCGRSSNNCNNHLYERALRIVYNDHSSTFQDLLLKDNSVSIHHRNIFLLAIELYKAKNNLSSQLMLELLQREEVNYNICSLKDFSLGSANTSSYGLNSLRYLAQKICALYHKICSLQTAFSNLLGNLSRGYLMVVLVF